LLAGRKDMPLVEYKDWSFVVAVPAVVIVVGGENTLL